MSKQPRIGVYPGTFDPPTRGHLDIIQRSLKVLDRLIVGVAVNAGKGPLFSLEERVAMVEEEVKDMKNGDGSAIDVKTFDNLLMEFAADIGASIVVRGLRAVSDFEYEFQMTGMNARLKPDIETVFLMAGDRYQFISSGLVKEICALGGDIAEFVSPRVQKHLEDRFKRK